MAGGGGFVEAGSGVLDPNLRHNFLHIHKVELRLKTAQRPRFHFA